MNLKLMIIALIFLTQSCASKMDGPNYNVGKSHNETNSLRRSTIKKEVNRNWKNTKKIRNRSKYSKIATKKIKNSGRFNHKKFIR